MGSRVQAQGKTCQHAHVPNLFVGWGFITAFYESMWQRRGTAFQFIPKSSNMMDKCRLKPPWPRQKSLVQRRRKKSRDPWADTSGEVGIEPQSLRDLQSISSRPKLADLCMRCLGPSLCSFLVQAVLAWLARGKQGGQSNWHKSGL